MPVVAFLVFAATFYGAVTLNQEMTVEQSQKRIPAALAGVVASGGLTLSQMVYPSVVQGFLDLSGLARGDWDATLMFVMGGGVIVSFLSYQFVPGHHLFTNFPKMEKPLVADKFTVPTNKSIDWHLIVGALFFGIGWGISGLCPGPALLLTMKGLPGMVLLWWPVFYIGNRLAEVVRDTFPLSASLVSSRCDCEKGECEDFHPTQEMSQEIRTDERDSSDKSCEEVEQVRDLEQPSSSP